MRFEIQDCHSLGTREVIMVLHPSTSLQLLPLTAPISCTLKINILFPDVHIQLLENRVVFHSGESHKREHILPLLSILKLVLI